ncbi:MAG: aspartyl-phosphate phosphatase Spo0E family protein [Halanaerobiales bacterium]
MKENISTLREKIKKQRKKLITEVENKRLDDMEVLKKSEKLDKLITQYFKK